MGTIYLRLRIDHWGAIAGSSIEVVIALPHLHPWTHPRPSTALCRTTSADTDGAGACSRQLTSAAVLSGHGGEPASCMQESGTITLERFFLETQAIDRVLGVC